MVGLSELFQSIWTAVSRHVSGHEVTRALSHLEFAGFEPLRLWRAETPSCQRRLSESILACALLPFGAKSRDLL